MKKTLIAGLLLLSGLLYAQMPHIEHPCSEHNCVCDWGWIKDSMWVDGMFKLRGELNTADSVRFIELVECGWKGAGWVNGESDLYCQTNSVDDIFYSYPVKLPFLIAGGCVIVDTITLGYYTQGTEDSIKIILATISNGVKTKIDSTAWLYNATGWRQSSTIIPGGDLTMKDNTLIAFIIRCDNNGANDIRISGAPRFVYHLE